MNDIINLFAGDLLMKRKDIEAFYEGHPERKSAAKEWYENIINHGGMTNDDCRSEKDCEQDLRNTNSLQRVSDIA